MKNKKCKECGTEIELRNFGRGEKMKISDGELAEYRQRFRYMADPYMGDWVYDDQVKFVEGLEERLAKANSLVATLPIDGNGNIYSIPFNIPMMCHSKYYPQTFGGKSIQLFRHKGQWLVSVPVMVGETYCADDIPFIEFYTSKEAMEEAEKSIDGIDIKDQYFDETLEKWKTDPADSFTLSHLKFLVDGLISRLENSKKEKNK